MKKSSTVFFTFVMFIVILLNGCLTKDIEVNSLTDTIQADGVMAYIIKNIDGIVSGNVEPPFLISELLDAHPSEFAAIIALGESAFPYLESIYLEEAGYGDYLNRGVVALTAKYAIKSEIYDMVSPSPNGKYYFKQYVGTFDTVYRFEGNLLFPRYSFSGYSPRGAVHYDLLQLIENETGAIIWETNINMLDVKVNWSPNSRYAAISSHYHWFEATDILDIQTLTLITTPQLEDLTDFFGYEIPIYYFRKWFRFSEWITFDKVKIDIFIMNAYGRFVDGWYVYDLSENIVVDADYFHNE